MKNSIPRINRLIKTNEPAETSPLVLSILLDQRLLKNREEFLETGRIGDLLFEPFDEVLEIGN